ncbi:hypothetical protein CXF72_04035 [Psychromonas sp. MB-3u-54]|uniref:hypothetical protein n=1 Tax=Psychromonas sp. MB-3u-54 TaxID=2058319 RepID=UPI000C339520|nr:hypothetical protein [Psychromonas sp. MB-3u-54]PKH03844.1 hypothetical protein CXF72_04035 [Psychromonas sp. MB-3u-54]
MKSREVFNDCVSAKDYFVKAVEAKDYQQAKILWFSCVTLLRTIGHVLHKVDAQNFDVTLQEELFVQFKVWKSSEPIFKEFIEKERNNILKEYDICVEVSEVKESVNLITSDGFQLVSSDGYTLQATNTIEDFVKANGYCKGESPISILNSALNWWDIKLKKFE